LEVVTNILEESRGRCELFMYEEDGKWEWGEKEKNVKEGGR
jgi:hypothetical protein